jgi:hypothetical protein
MLGNTVAKITSNRIRPEQFYAYMFKAIVEAEETIAFISARPVDMHWVTLAYDPDMPTSISTFLAQVTEKWSQIRPDLSLFKRGGTLAR